VKNNFKNKKGKNVNLVVLSRSLDRLPINLGLGDHTQELAAQVMTTRSTE
jgi:sialic acid synthase SpsE